MPQALLEQLVDGGRLVIPVGEQTQILKIITRKGDSYSEQQVEAAGNTALLGAKLALFADEVDEDHFDALKQRVEHVSLAADESFQQLFIAETALPRSTPLA